MSSLTTILTCAHAAESCFKASDDMGRLQIAVFVKSSTPEGKSTWELPYNTINDLQGSAIPATSFPWPSSTSPSLHPESNGTQRVTQLCALGSHRDLTERAVSDSTAHMGQ